ncbi:MAG: hypothetical protein O3A85_06585 [Proteobacteria bacterium]|nr:hypothetical protein [Pseudomonadota bacterium]
MKIHQWRTSFETGNAEIDGQHRKMVECLKEIDTYIAKGNKKAFDECLKFRKANADHAAFEESLLAEAGFSRLEMHRKAHKETEGKMQELFATCREACKDPQPTSCTKDLSYILIDHLLRSDLDFKSFLQNKNLANDSN